MEAGRSIMYERVKDWWGEKLPINLGSYNYEKIRFVYFRDPTIALQAFKAGDIDFRLESSAKVWATEYNIPALKRGDMIKRRVHQDNAQGMQGLAFNIRRPFFQDPKVRRAIAYAFNFQWVNKHLFYSEYKRSNSYFANCDLAARGLPEGEELKILSKYRKELPEEVFTQPFEMPVIDQKYTIRSSLEQARKWLREAGWEVKNEILVNKETGEPFKFEILLAEPAFERVVNSFIQNLKYLGIQANIRLIDPNIYLVRTSNFDFDMIMASFPQSNSPGNEQWDYWGSKTADIKGSRNYVGIKNPVIDQIIPLIVDAEMRSDLVESVRALDRVLLWNFYVVNGWYNDSYRIAYWNLLGFPKVTPQYGLGFDTWWYDEVKAKTIQQS